MPLPKSTCAFWFYKNYMPSTNNSCTSTTAKVVLITIKIQRVLCTRCRNSICCHLAALLATCRQRLALAVQELALPGTKQNYELHRNQANNREAHPTPSLAHGATWIRTLYPGLGAVVCLYLRHTQFLTAILAC